MSTPSKETNRQLDGLFAHARVSLTNGRDVTEVQAILKPLGYDPKKLGEGLSLLDAAVREAKEQVVEYEEQYAATATLDQQVRAWKAAYIPHLELARLKFRGVPAAGVLALKGTRRKDVAGVTMQGRLLYEGLRDDADLGAAMAEWNVGPGVIAAALAAIDGIDRAAVAQAKEAGEAEVATAERDTAVRALLDFLIVYEGLARIVLADVPQLMETLGLRESGS
ncbi:MAG TPA: hypothetical protein VGB53_14285 [Rubricoccaceae bacterium]|jgi:hypothetical protein